MANSELRRVSPGKSLLLAAGLIALSTAHTHAGQLANRPQPARQKVRPCLRLRLRR